MGRRERLRSRSVNISQFSLFWPAPCQKRQERNSSDCWAYLKSVSTDVEDPKIILV